MLKRREMTARKDFGFRVFATGLLVAVIAGLASAQSFNIDMDTPGLGGGVPSSGFGGAAGTPGLWNKIHGAGFGTHFLKGLDGNLTSARIVGPEGGSGGGTNIPINTGNYALLLNDGRTVGVIGDPLSFHFDGLQNGQYRVYTYAVPINLPWTAGRTRVEILEASQASVQYSLGPMPGNQLIQGITHTVHDALVTSNELHVVMESLEPHDNTWFNGMQISYIPEPATFVSVSIGVLMIVRKTVQRRKA
jgi:hypothetical protein